jgi:hypothetical protein
VGGPLRRHPSRHRGGSAWTRVPLAGLALAISVLAVTAVPGGAADVTPPVVLSVDNASGVSYTTAKLSGSVERPADPDPSFDADCEFEYVINTQFLGTGFKNATPAPCNVDPLTTPGPNPVSAELSGLRPGAEYHFRLTASNAGGSDSLVAAATFTTTAVTPPSATIATPTAVTASSAHFSGQINPQLGSGDPGLYEVKWRFQCTPQCLDSAGQPLSGPPIPADNSAHAVAADATLEPNTVYRVSLVAANAGETATAGPLTFATDPVPPLARTLGAAAGVDSAQLGAKVNPFNSIVTYQFEWGSTTAYGNLAPAAPESLSTADSTFHVVAEQISGLAPQTTYHYRVHVTNTETGEEAFGVDRTFTTLPIPAPPAPCPNAASRAGASAGLPNCRAFEFATPGLGDSSPVGWPGIVVEGVRADGSAVAFLSGDAPADAEGSTATTNTLLASRGPAGWTTKSLSAPTPLASGTDFGDRRSTVGISSDLSQSVLWSNQPLAGSASPPGTNLFLRRADGSFRVLTEIGAPTFSAGGDLAGASQDFTHLFIVSTVKQLGTDPVAGGNTYEWVNGQLRLVTILPGPGEEPAPAGGSLPDGALPPVSDDGSKALFKAVGLKDLFLRIDGSQTVEVSASQRNIDPDPNPTAEAIAAGISADGSEVLFTSASELTEDAYTGRTGGLANDRGADLYSYDVVSGKLTDLTVDENPADVAAGADVEQVVGASRDASYIYFVAHGNLAPGATSGERNLYVEHEGEIDFVGTDPAAGSASSAPFYVTPDGHHAAFATTEPQTGYDNDGFAEVYRYTFGSGLECASCRPSGEPPSGSALIAGRALSDDGSRVFFQSDDAVLPAARSGGSHVYEYEAGQIHLLTPGDGAPAVLVGASASGDDIFIAAFEELSPRGQGAVFAIYDARVNADVPPPVPVVGCQGETCRGSGSTAAGAVGAGSASFEASAKVAIAGPKSVKGPKAQLRVIVPGRGDLTISGRGLKSLKKQVSGVGSVPITLTLKPVAEEKRQRVGSFKTEVGVLFKSSGGEISRADLSFKFEASAKRKGKK